MALPDPPCIEGLVGCSYTEWYSVGTGSSVGNTSVGMNTGNSSSSLASGLNSFSSSSFNNAQYSSASSLRSSSSFSSSQGSIGRFLTGKRLAVYTVTVQNPGSAPVSGITFTHGPLPASALLDGTKSSPGCVQEGSLVTCSFDLGAGKNKEFTLTYIVNNSVGCTLYRSLQKVTLTPGTSVTSSVSCVTQSSVSQSSSSSLSSSISSSAASLYTETRTGGILAYTSPDLAAGLVTNTGVPTTNQPYLMPKTGVSLGLFSRTEAAGASPMPFVADSSWPIWPIVSFTLVAWLTATFVVNRFLASGR